MLLEYILEDNWNFISFCGDHKNLSIIHLVTENINQHILVNYLNRFLSFLRNETHFWWSLFILRLYYHKKSLFHNFIVQDNYSDFCLLLAITQCPINTIWTFRFGTWVQPIVGWSVQLKVLILIEIIFFNNEKVSILKIVWIFSYLPDTT